MSSKYFVLVIFVCLAVVVVAQTDTARVIGTITDTTGAVLPNATVTITDLGTGRVVTAKTNEREDTQSTPCRLASTTLT